MTSTLVALAAVVTSGASVTHLISTPRLYTDCGRYALRDRALRFRSRARQIAQ
jgi:hypothetical protein